MGVAAYSPAWPSVQYGGFLEFATENAQTANYTITAPEAGTLYTNSGATGAVTFTLPTRSPGLLFGFFVIANQNVLVTSAAGTDIVVFNNASASTIAFQTAGQLIGGFLSVWCNYGGTKWYANVQAKNAITIS